MAGHDLDPLQLDQDRVEKKRLRPKPSIAEQSGTTSLANRTLRYLGNPSVVVLEKGKVISPEKKKIKTHRTGGRNLSQKKDRTGIGMTGEGDFMVGKGPLKRTPQARKLGFISGALRSWT